jgi:hypothetical protein
MSETELLDHLENMEALQADDTEIRAKQIRGQDEEAKN